VVAGQYLEIKTDCLVVLEAGLLDKLEREALAIPQVHLLHREITEEATRQIMTAVLEVVVLVQ